MDEERFMKELEDHRFTDVDNFRLAFKKNVENFLGMPTIKIRHVATCQAMWCGIEVDVAVVQTDNMNEKYIMWYIAERVDKHFDGDRAGSISETLGEAVVMFNQAMLKREGSKL